jgi:hypothetical protein
MHRLMSILMLVAVCSLTNVLRAEALLLTGPRGVGATIDDMRVAEGVHCRPGSRHHRARPYDGCHKVQRRGPAIVRPSPPSAPMRENWGFRHNGGFGSLHEAW